ncbi:MAG: CHAT domain-containing protein [Acidobacteriota bacterium]
MLLSSGQTYLVGVLKGNMKNIHYFDFDVSIERTASGYRTRVLSSPAGQAYAEFVPSFTDLELENFLLRVGRTRRGVRRINSPEMESAKNFGGRLFNALFKDEVRGCLRSSLDDANRQEAGLRFRLHLSGVPELADLPWEYLYNPTLNRFLCLSAETPLIRYIELPELIRPISVKPPLKLLAVISSPSDYPPLDVDREWEKLNEALRDIVQQGLLKIERLADARLTTLQRQLRQGEYHIFHFVGHGGFNTETQDGVLLLEDETHRGRQVSGQDLGMLLYDQRTLRLVVLNACEGARTSRTDPFAGAAQSLVQQRIPAVIAMQFEITDDAAISLAHEFYGALADGYPVDAALGEARKALFAQGNDVEWGTPVLYLRAPDGRIFDVERVSDDEKNRARAVALGREAQAFMVQEDWAGAIEKWQSVLAIDPEQKQAADRLKESQRQQELATLYAAGRQDMEAQRWNAASDSLRRIQGLQSNYKDVDALIAKIQTEIQPAPKPVQPAPAPVIAPKEQIEKSKGRGLSLIGVIVGVLLSLTCIGGLGMYALSAVFAPTPTRALAAITVAFPSSPSDTPAPRPADTSTPEPPTASPPTAVPIIPPTPTPPPTSTPVDTSTPIPSPTKPPPAATPTVFIPPGVYVTAIRVDPPNPKRAQPMTFYVTFLNTNSGPAGYRWRVRIFTPDNLRHSLGDTSPLSETFPVGASEHASADNWKVTGIVGCIPLMARAYVVVPQRDDTEFLYLNSNRVELNFQVCP